jgi:putative transcriptional regulator
MSKEAAIKTKLKEFRLKKSLTQEELAERVGVRRETIVFLEQGKYNPSLGLAFKIARELGVPLTDIFSYS